MAALQYSVSECSKHKKQKVNSPEGKELCLVTGWGGGPVIYLSIILFI